ncbi:hypothetical protein [Undibacterium sp. TJN19]|uniref:hypothetical protein n=1 Tax=Undibacterium sp. TJN19 TaxID=3413055 RepID=UPI003BF0AF65
MTELFNNTHDALTFAFNYSGQQYALSPMSKLALKGAGSGKGLISVDGAGQAGMILAEVDRLAPIHRSCIIVRYANKLVECKCCGAESPSEAFKTELGSLRELATSQITGMSVRGMREAIVRAFYDRKISITREAERLGVAKSSAHDNKQLIWSWLKNVDAAAQHQIAERLARICVQSSDNIAA